MKFSLGMIVRDEEKTLERCLQSVAPYVDEIIIGLGGKSTDKTPKIARKYATKVLQIDWEDHFAAARNGVLKEVTGTHFLWLDGDDELIGGDRLRSHIERHPEVGAFHMGYDYGQDDAGHTISFLVRERVVRLDLEWFWEGRIHEYLRTETPHNTFYIPDVMVKHHESGKKRGRRNLELLYRDLQESEPNPSQRLLFYLGREEMLRGSDQAAIAHLQRFIANSEWGPESYQAAHTIADIHRREKRLNEAERADLVAIRMNPEWPDAYFGLAETSFLRAEWKACIEWSKVGAEKQPPETSLVVNPRDYDFNPVVLVAISYTNLGDLQMALENFRKAYDVAPSPQLEDQLITVHKKARANKVLDSYLHVIEYLARHDEWLKVRKIFEVAPKVLESHPRVIELYRNTMLSTTHVDDPEIMKESYRQNQGWFPAPEEGILEYWKDHPRMRYGVDVARQINAETIVDIGCSDGFIDLPLANEGFKVDGVDLDPRCVKLANERAFKYKLEDYAHFYEGDISTVGEWSECEKFVKYDLAIAFEIIEHVVNPADLLSVAEKAAKHVAITTPFMAWENGEVDWQKVEPKYHLRIFDLQDFEILLAPRGRIRNLYRKPWGASAWIFADYEPSATHDKNIVIATGGIGLESWGPQKLREEGLGGSETAVIRLAEEMAAQGHLVTVYNNIDSPGYHNYVRYRDNDSFIPEVASDVLIAWRAPEIADLNPRAGQLFLWMHDTDAGDRLTEERAAKFDKIVTLSDWHRGYLLKRYPFLTETKVVVIGNGVDLERFNVDVERDEKRVIYASSPDRGLDVILEHIWPKVVREVPDAELHYYYGWNNINTLEGNYPHLREFKNKVATLSLDTKNVFNHGRITQEELAKELKRGNIWLYPTYFMETYCITGVEAQLAGLFPVYNPIAALDETVQSGTPIHGDVRDPAIGDKYADIVIEQLKNPVSAFARDKIADSVYFDTWGEIANEWLWLMGYGSSTTESDQTLVLSGVQAD